MMEDKAEDDLTKVQEQDVCVNFENTNYSWGFTLDKEKAKKGQPTKL
jgi:hypothetical protein